MDKKYKLTLGQYLGRQQFTEEEVVLVLEEFVKAGVLIEVKKNGQRAWKNNPKFKELPKKEQKKILNTLSQK